MASKLLGRPAGVVSGSALLVDYVLTITVSIAAAGDVIFSFLPPAWMGLKLPMEITFIFGLTTLNIRGVRESAMALAPIFMVFVLSHAAVIIGGVLGHAGQIPDTARQVSSGFHNGIGTLGIGGMFLLFIHAYSLGGGTYTGIEAVSNGLPIMREPRVQTAKRTMLYMAVSLACTAAGLAGLLPALGRFAGSGQDPERRAGRKDDRAHSLRYAAGHHHAVFGRRSAGGRGPGRIPGRTARAGEHGHRSLGAASFCRALRSADHAKRHRRHGRRVAGGPDLHRGRRRQAGGHVQHQRLPDVLAVHVRDGQEHSDRTRPDSPTGSARRSCSSWAFILCATILAITVFEKFREGGWLTLLVTSGVVALCFVIRGHYRKVELQLQTLYRDVRQLDVGDHAALPITAPKAPTACVLVPSYGGVGIHTVLNVFRAFPNHFQNLVFVSVGVIDSGGFKGADGVEALDRATDDDAAQVLFAGDHVGRAVDVQVHHRDRRGRRGRKSSAARSCPSIRW